MSEMTKKPFTPFNEMTDEEHDYYQQLEYEDMMYIVCSFSSNM